MAWYEEEAHHREASAGEGLQGVYRELYAQSFRAAGATTFFVLKAETESGLPAARLAGGV